MKPYVLKPHVREYLLALPKLSAYGSKELSRTQSIAGELLHSGQRRTGWAYAYKSPVWHEINSLGRTSCGRIFNSHRATWCQEGTLPNEIERCTKCEASRAKHEAAEAEQARIKHETRQQLSLEF